MRISDWNQIGKNLLPDPRYWKMEGTEKRYCDVVPTGQRWGAMYGVLRLIGAIGFLKNRMWGLVLSVMNCVITIALMMFLLPAEIMDGILAGSALVLMLTQYFGDKKIIE